MNSKKKLKNGLTVLTAPVKSTRAITVWALFPVGSRYEKSNISGASHFVEHLMFKGTERRPTAMDISKELDAVGAEYNAFTFKDYTGYYIKIAVDKQKLAFDILSDMLFHSTFDKIEVEREKGVIIEEMRMYEDNPTMAVDSLLERALFGNHPLGWDIIGNHKTLTQMSRKDLWNYYKAAYQPQNCILVVAGAVNKDSFKFIDSFFGTEKSVKSDFKEKGFENFAFSSKILPLKKRIVTQKRKIDQAHLLLGLPGIKYTDKQRDVLSVLLSILSGGMSSRLFVEVREKRGLAYMVRAGHIPHRDTGYFYIQAGLDPKRLGEAFKVIKDELKKISNELVPKKEMDDAKNNLLGHFILSMEDSDNQAAIFAKNFMFLREMTDFDKIISQIKKVTSEEVRALAKKIFVENQIRVALVSSLTEEQAIKILK